MRILKSIFLFMLILVLISCTSMEPMPNKANDPTTYRLTGQSKAWKIDDQQVRVAQEEVEYKNGKLYYLGQKDPNDMEYLVIRIYLEDGRRVLGKSITNNIQFRDGYIKLDEVKDSPINFMPNQLQGIYAEVEWMMDGEAKQVEKINLQVEKLP